MHLPGGISKMAQDDSRLAIVYVRNDLHSKVGVTHFLMFSGHIGSGKRKQWH